MKIGIVIHTQSGHTLNFAKIIEKKLTQHGHEVDIKGLRTKGAVKPRSRKFDLIKIPEIDEYDVLLFGGPVWAFTASPVVLKYLGSLETLKGKKALCFVTMGLPFPSLGGKQAIKAMEEDLALSGAEILPGEIVWYFFSGDEEKMKAAATRINDAIGEP
ncbi:flavodoxin [Chitinispirillum alkaliphilum]|nr:flavodoxin [Chitinispirillum alkaliphilum]